MRNVGLLWSLALLLFVSTTAGAQRYSNIIDQTFSEADLRYMPLEELTILSNEIIALKGAQTNKKGSYVAGSPYLSFSSTAQFLQAADQANLDLIQQMKMENETLTCTDQELFEVFFQLAKSRQAMPIYLAEKFYGVPLKQDMVAHQKMLPLHSGLIAFWVPEFPSDCEVCPYLNHFVVLNVQSGERMASLETEGLMTLLEENILEVKNYTDVYQGTTTKPEYYHIMENGQLISKESQVVQLQKN